MNPSPRTPGPVAGAPPQYHPGPMAAHSPWSIHGYPTGNFIAPPAPQQFYPYPVTPPATPIYPPMPPWGYPQVHMPQLEPHTPGPHRNITNTNNIHVAAQPSGLEDWCNKHNLGNEERLGLLKLGFRVGDNNLITLPTSEWEWAGLGPLHKQRILAAYNAEHV